MNRLFAIGHVIAFILACALIWGVDGFMYKSSAGLSNKNVNPYYDSSVGADADFSKGLPILSKLAELEQEIEGWYYARLKSVNIYLVLFLVILMCHYYPEFYVT